jgi:hypothetical protein
MAVMFLKERRSPVRRVFCLFRCGDAATHIAFAVMAVSTKRYTENRRRTGDRRSLEK